MTAITRKIKEELLQASYPEVYGASVKKLEKLESKMTSGKKRKASSEALDETFLPKMRRPYQWRGRRVLPQIKPGNALVVTQPSRSKITTKRSYDEVMGDDDILYQAETGMNEFAYGKRAKIEDVVVLDNKNPTPSLIPVTPQTIVGKKRPGAPIDLQPTVQLMVPSKLLKIEPVKNETPNILLDPLPAMAVIKRESTIPETVNSSAVATAPKMEVEDIKVRSFKQITPEVGVQTVDVEMPLTSANVQTSSISTQTELMRPTSKARYIVPHVRYHPSIRLGPKVVRRRRRRRRRRVRRNLPRRYTASGQLLPNVIYHPSLRP